MAGHTATPYEVVATRKYVRDPVKKREHLLLASIGDDVPIDLLDVVEAHVCGVTPHQSADKTTKVACIRAARKGDAVMLVLATEVTGEREIIMEGPTMVLAKGDQHVTVSYSVAMLWRPPKGTRGVLMTHSPWGRGGNRGVIMKLLQRALGEEPAAKAKLGSDPLVPQGVVEAYLRQAEATKIIYTRTTGVRSLFDGGTSAPADMDLVVKGSNSLPYRNALAAALKRGDKSRIFTVRVRNDAAPDGYEEQEFDDVSVDLPTPGGLRRYSLKKDTIPTLGYDMTADINAVYGSLPPDWTEWPDHILDAARPHMRRLVSDVARGM